VTGAGELNRRLTLQAPLEVEDGAGGFTRTYAAVSTLWVGGETTNPFGPNPKGKAVFTLLRAQDITKQLAGILSSG
jgi:hypothetical protein